MTQMVNNLAAMQETRIQTLGQENPLEKGMATHSSILAWEILWTEEPGGLQGSQVLAVLIPACASSSLAFHMMHSAYKLNKQGDNLQP